MANAFPVNWQSLIVKVIVTVDLDVRSSVQSTPAHLRPAGGDTLTVWVETAVRPPLSVTVSCTVKSVTAVTLYV
jgi:hypothetical protein